MGLLLNDECHIIVSIIKRLQIISICSSYVSSLPMQIVHVLLSLSLLLLVVLCRMFSHHVFLEARGLSALVLAVFTGKRLLASVRSQVLFKIVSLIAGKVAMITLKRLLVRMSEHMGLKDGSL